MAARFDYHTCEPFRAWNRVEPRVRKEDFDRVLRCEIHDPLWMLTRQWQFGEFKGEDTGSAIFAKTLVKTSKIARFKAFNGTAQPYRDDIPLEALVESEPQKQDFRKAVQAGRRWMNILQVLGTQFNDASPGSPHAFSLNDYRQKFTGLFPFSLPTMPTPDESNNNHALDIQKSKLLSNRKLLSVHAALHNRSIDGLAIYKAIKNNSLAVRSWRIHEVHEDLLVNAANQFKGWIENTFAYATSADSAWNGKQLEYQFSVSMPEYDGGHTVLAADQYFHGHLDWFAFDVDTQGTDHSGLNNIPADVRNNALKKKVQTFIPAPAEFGGMPNSRWWQFEDNQVDLGNISADTTDLAKVLLSEFALIYGNDWFVLPYPAEVGSVLEIDGILVTDVFGQKTLVQPALQGLTDDWESWGLFNLSPRQTGTNNSSLKPDTRLFLPPAVGQVMESEPIEEVLFIRDEMANMVWAIETKIPDLLTRSQDGKIAANELTDLWLKLQGIDPDAEPEIAEQAVYQYKLGNEVPENWIPFIAIHKKDGQNRAVRLQRASMPRLYFKDFMPVRPRTQILGEGLKDDPSREDSPFVNPSREEQQNPFYINEEEILQAGIKIKAAFQRARWYNGKISNWYGYQKLVGKGEGSSGLAYDILKMVRKGK